MGLRLITGRSGSGKTKLCLEEISSKQKIGKRLIYIVPEQFSLQAERELVKESGGIMPAVVLSFRRLAENIFSECGISGDKNLTDIGKLMILRRIIMQNKDKFEYFGIACERSGFTDRMANAVTEFFSGGITPEALKSYAETFEEGSAVRNKLSDMALIYGEYRNFIKKDYISSDDVLTTAAIKMSEADYIKGAEVWLDGFYGFTCQEFDIISRLLAECERVNITLTIDKKSVESTKMSMVNGFFEPWDTMRRLKKICEDNGFNIEKTICLEECHRFNTEGMKNIERKYFSYAFADGKNSSGGVKLMTAESLDDEINMCASEIIHLVRDKGLRFRDIALTSRSLSDCEETVRRVFSHYGIPFFMDSKKSVMGHPYTEFVRSVIEMTADNLSYESIFRCLKTELTPLERDDRDKLENYVLRYGIKGDTWTDAHWQWGFEKEETTEKEDEINALRELAINPFKDFYKKYKSGKHSAAEITSDLYGISVSLEIADRLAQKAEEDDTAGNAVKAQEHIRCFDLISGLCQSISELLGDETMTIREYGQIFEAGLSGLKMGIVPECIDSVTVGDIERTRLPEIKALFVIGVNEGVLPSNDTDIKGILTERERTALEELGAELSHSGARLAFEEQYLIYMGITKPSDYLYICRNLTDSSGIQTRPSSVITRLERIFGDIETEEFNPYSVKAVDRPIPVLHRIGEKLAEGGDMDALWNGAYKWLENNSEYSSAAELLKKGTEYKNKENNLSKANREKLFGNELHTSISRLEAFSECPFYYYAKYSLKVSPRRIYGLQTPDLGSLFHAVLEKFTSDMKAKGYDWNTIPSEEANELIESAIDLLAPDTADKVLFSTAANAYMLRRIKRITKRAVSVLKKHMESGGFKTAGVEIGFGGGDGDLPPIEIEMPGNRKLVLNGKIDRVDVYRSNGKGYVKIIDYKSGRKEFSLSDIYYGLQLQLLLYMDAFMKTGKFITIDEPEPGGAFYFRIMDPVIKSSDLKGRTPEDTLYSQFCMSGLVCAEEDVLEALDNIFADDGKNKSNIINVSKNKSGDLTGSAVNRSYYGKIIDYTVKKAGEIGGRIADGEVEIYPTVNGTNTICSFCEYNSICCFDENCGNQRNKLKKLSASEVWDRVLSDKNKD